jgi:hypothetical protein
VTVVPAGTVLVVFSVAVMEGQLFAFSDLRFGFSMLVWGGVSLQRRSSRVVCIVVSVG